MAVRKISSEDAFKLKIGSVESDCWRVYRNSPIGRSLLDALNSMQVDRELLETVLVLFDAAVRKWMVHATLTGEGILRFWADKVVAFRHVDRQLKIVLKEAQVYMMIEADIAEPWLCQKKKGKQRDELVGVHLCDSPHMIIEAHSPFDRNVPGPYMYENRPVQIVATVSESANPWQQYFSFKAIGRM